VNGQQGDETMTTTTFNGTALAVDAEGFLQDPAQWSDELAEAWALDLGLSPLSGDHWKVIRFMRERYLDTGAAPSIRTLGKASGVDVKTLYQLFPKGPAKLAARLAGIPKPKGCI
jgi:TusE/DsrC/DsvC family sulfur relay protein